ncbi:MAG: SurA N-terminal domain-containing protein [Kiritimatiellae bacterium]|nr:SurA N-terminal domain-containing protein [Kiritimatiellia bacterium]
MKQAYVNGELISPEAVQFEMDRLMKFYLEHGVKAEDIKPNLEKLLERAREQAIGAKLLLMRAEQLDMPVPDSELDAEIEKIVKQMGGRGNFSRALAMQKMSEDELRVQVRKGCRVNALVRQACQGVPEPEEADVAEYFATHKADFTSEDGESLTLVDVADQIRDLLRHEARGRAVDAFVAELREKATIEYK